MEKKTCSYKTRKEKDFIRSAGQSEMKKRARWKVKKMPCLLLGQNPTTREKPGGQEIRNMSRKSKGGKKVARRRRSRD